MSYLPDTLCGHCTVATGPLVWDRGIISTMGLDLPILNVPSAGSSAALPCALDLDLERLAGLFEALGQPPYRARQAFRALHQRWVATWDECTELPSAVRRELAARFRVASGETVAQARSDDGTRKRLVRLADGQEI